MSAITSLNRKSRRREKALQRRQGKTSFNKSALTRGLAVPLAAGAVAFGVPQTTQAQVVPQPQCVISGTTVTCTGDLSGGVEVISPNGMTTYDTLDINNVAAPGITPAAMIDGIRFEGNAAQDINITVDLTGTSGIMTNGDGGNGIFAEQSAGAGIISITSTGDISTNGQDADGIYAIQNGGDGDVSITSVGMITANGYQSDAIFAAQDAGNGNVSVTSTGDLSTVGDDAAGIFAQQSFGPAGTGNVAVVSQGNIATQGEYSYGIAAQQLGTSGSVNVNSTGDVNTVGNYAFAIGGIKIYGNGDVSITSTGDISTNGLLAAGVGGAIQSASGNITVTSNGNVSTQGAMSFGVLAQRTYGSGSGDTSLTSVGDISTTGDSSPGVGVIQALLMGSSNATISSTGTITTQGSYSSGIIAQQLGGDGNITITSNGDITAPGSSSAGIVAYLTTNMGNVDIMSTGNISSYDDSIYGATVNGNVSIINNGNITSSVEEGIDAEIANNGNITVNTQGTVTSEDEAIDATVRNDGDISITNNGPLISNDSNGIDTNIYGSGNTSILNNGDINADVVGIFAGIGGAGSITIENSASLTAQEGIVVYRAPMAVANATITNSGSVTGTSGSAINLAGNGNDTVNLQPGSTITGAIDFGNGNDGAGGTNTNDIDTLNFAPGLNAVVNFADAGGPGQGDSDLESAPEIINFGSAGVVTNGGFTAIALDTSTFAAQGPVANDLVDATLNALEVGGTLQVQLDSAPQTASLTDERRFAADVDISAPARRDRNLRLWGSLFGGVSEVGATTTTSTFDHHFGGLVSGIEGGDIDRHGTFGVLGGYSESAINQENGLGDLDISSGFGGIYWKRAFELFNLNLSVLGGFTDNQQTRIVGGLAANGNFNGRFIAPSATVSIPIDTFEQRFVLSSRVSYVNLNLDGFTETGAAAGLLTIGDRTVSLFNVRGLLTLPHSDINDDGSQTDVNVGVGVEATFNTGSDVVNASTLGTPFSFTTDTTDDVVALFNLRLGHTFAGGRTNIGATAEVQSDFDANFQASGTLSASFKF